MSEATSLVSAQPAPVKSKTCFKCNEHKPLSEFYAHREMRDGTLNKCKACTKKDAAEREARLSQNPEWVLLERMRHRLKSAKARLEGAVAKISTEKKREALRRSREKHPQKDAARDAVRRAIRSGKLTKKPCEVCGNIQVEAHHDDYTKPLYVRWLCTPHHAEHHVIEREKELLSKL